MTAHIDFAPDGVHWQTIKKGKIGSLWDYFNFSHDVWKQICLNPHAKFRLVGDTGKVISCLPRNGEVVK